MHESKFIINVKTVEKLNNDEKSEILQDFRARLQGYTTESPETLKGANIMIIRDVTFDDIAERLSIKNLHKKK